jgi:hypothetical protein
MVFASSLEQTASMACAALLVLVLHTNGVAGIQIGIKTDNMTRWDSIPDLAIQ